MKGIMLTGVALLAAAWWTAWPTYGELVEDSEWPVVTEADAPHVGATGPPIAATLAFRSSTINPRCGARFRLAIRATKPEGAWANLSEALRTMRFVFTPDDRKGDPLRLPGPFRTSRPSAKLRRVYYAESDGEGWVSALRFPRDVPPNCHMNTDYPTPPPGRYRVRVELTFPEGEAGWSGVVRSPLVMVTVVAPHAPKIEPRPGR